jgi:hypothetical protein
MTSSADSNWRAVASRPVLAGANNVNRTGPRSARTRSASSNSGESAVRFATTNTLNVTAKAEPPADVPLYDLPADAPN